VTTASHPTPLAFISRMSTTPDQRPGIFILDEHTTGRAAELAKLHGCVNKALWITNKLVGLNGLIET
jgi:hypothetical protein